MNLRIGNIKDVFNDGFWCPSNSKVWAYNIPLVKIDERRPVYFDSRFISESFKGTHLLLVDTQRLVVYIKDTQNG